MSIRRLARRSPAGSSSIHPRAASCSTGARATLDGGYGDGQRDVLYGGPGRDHFEGEAEFYFFGFPIGNKDEPRDRESGDEVWY
jgi:hypothetical protein